MHVTESAGRLADLDALKYAVIESRLAATLHEQGSLNEAEPFYRSSVQIFRRLERTEPRFLGRALLGLANIMVEPIGPEGERRSDATLEQAERFLEEAVSIFHAGGPDYLADQRKALETLQLLYTEVWDYPERLAEIEAELSMLGKDITPGLTPSPVLENGRHQGDYVPPS